jgi:hypothetical protein
MDTSEKATSASVTRCNNLRDMLLLYQAYIIRDSIVNSINSGYYRKIH